MPGTETFAGRAESGRAGVGVFCSHCGLPVPAALVEADGDLQFCCHGCRTVYAVIHEQRLDHYYDLAREGEEAGVPAATTGKSYEEFDDPAFHELYVRPAGNGLQAVELYLEGVHCAACVWLVEKVPLRVPGVAEARLEMRHSMARIVWDPRAARLSAIARFLDALGYAAHPFRGVRTREMRRREDRSLLIKIAVAGASAANVMMLAGALYGGMWHGMAAEFETLFRWASLVIALPALWAASVFLRGAWGSIRARALHMDVPITIGILAGFFWGSRATVSGSGEIYFDSVTALIFLLLVGRFIQQRRQRAAADSAELLYSLAPSSAHLIEQGRTRDVPLEALLPGMHVDVRAGEAIPVDGVVVAGSSNVDASLLTGESRPETVREGSAVNAGTLNLSSRVEVQVLAAGETTRLGRLTRLVEESALRRAPVVRLADRISGVFVTVVLALAALTLMVWWRVDSRLALDHTIALLIVTCPCALGLATPLAVSAAIGRAGRAGILIKGGDALERLATAGRVLLDKTGTLTLGRMRLVRWWGDESVKPLVAAVESGVSHPVARALADALADTKGPRAVDVERSADGAGVRGLVDGRPLTIGSPAFVQKEIGVIPAPAAAAVEEFAGEALTPVLVAVDKCVTAAAGIGDPLREGSRETVDELKRMGRRVGILSGDHPDVVAAVARSLGIDPDDARGGATPEDKLAAVERAAAEGSIVMVGDGVNDAAALSAATVGVAVHGGAETAMAVADVFLARRGIDSLVPLLEGANRTMVVIRRNLVFSLLYNLVGAILAMTGLIGPLIAAVLMPLSSLTVITYSFRSKTF
jgi:Cu2+-exporting ATPase